ncbi:hypothetical protein [Paenibacillus koleovorans]|uniref:hypothetical protein n=1 Tax=Paenibacillus koleovorans TaxID=121608 RepID=UPI000FD93863|nr:hypothetical protein [Paenibacillus koleovorans]
MAPNRRLLTDTDFQEAIDKHTHVRIFRDDHMIDSNTVITRFDGRMVVTQSGVSDVSYYFRDECEFFEMKRR